MNNSADNCVPCYPPMQNGWPTLHFPWDDSTPPMSHTGTPTEDFGLLNDLVQPVSHHNSCSPLQMPLTSTTTSVTPPVQPIAPLPIAAIKQSALSQPSLTMKQFNLSTVTDTPAPSPSSNDEECSASSPMSDKQSLSEFSEDLGICKSKQEILKLIPKDVRVPQSK